MDDQTISTLSNLSTVSPRGLDIQIPCLGFGVYQIEGEKCTTACKTALEAGYRLIDTAQLYRNEQHVGAAILASQRPRHGIFVTTKQGVRGDTPEATYNLAVESVRRIAGSGPDAYVDLFLIHVPYIRGDAEGRKEVWQALERLNAGGLARLIGVSNFTIDYIEEMKSYANVWPPHVSQIELHPWSQQRELVAYCKQYGIVLEAYSPLAEGMKMNDPVLAQISNKHSMSPEQVLIRYGLRKGWVVLPKSERTGRIEANANVFDFSLQEEDIKPLDGLEMQD